MKYLYLPDIIRMLIYIIYANIEIFTVLEIIFLTHIV